MLFRVTAQVPKVGKAKILRPCFYLVPDLWDDWFEYNTMYTVLYFDGTEFVSIGSTKVGMFGMPTGQRTAPIGGHFDAVGPKHFSVGQDDAYYERLNALGSDLRQRYLGGLNDLAYRDGLLDRAKRQQVTRRSLMRFVTESEIQGKFRRMAYGGARLTSYQFTYRPPLSDGHAERSAELTFQVVPQSQPPTNIHVLVGRNGVGKTTLIRSLVATVLHPTPDDRTGRFRLNTTEHDSASEIANLVSVAFSAFDRADEVPGRGDLSVRKPTYAYIGLMQRTRAVPPSLRPKTTEQLAEEFVRSLQECSQGARRERWISALTVLQSDPIFAEAELLSLVDAEHEDVAESARKVFGLLSSGHKIVLLSMTRLVEVVEERTLVLLDEPEAHLHPPLLSAFIRALSQLLTDRNGVAVIATHSPVILQEVPRSCVWKIVRRKGVSLTAERPRIETFGENVGVLTHEVFGLEVTNSGFHSMIFEAAIEAADLDELVKRFNGQLGGEARAIARVMMAIQEEDNNA